MSISTCTNKTVLLLLLHQSKEKEENERAEGEALFEKTSGVPQGWMCGSWIFLIYLFLIQCLLS